MLKKLFVVTVLSLFSAQAHATPEFDACYKKAKDDNEVALCMKAENARLLKQIQEIYLNVANAPQTKSWNKGNGLISGNLKDMYNSWLAYRNRYCSLYVVASEHTFGSSSYDREKCMLNFTKDHLDLMKTIIINANSGGEEDDEE